MHVSTAGTIGVGGTGGIAIAYERHGNPDGPPLLLVHGLGMQLVAWHPDLLGALVSRGYDLVVCDNRDVGRSTHLAAAGRPDLRALRSGEAAGAGGGRAGHGGGRPRRRAVGDRGDGPRPAAGVLGAHPRPARRRHPPRGGGSPLIRRTQTRLVDPGTGANRPV